MSDRMMRAGEQIARRVQDQAVERTAEQLRSLLPSASIQTDDDHLVIEMRNLLSSWLTNSDLRFLAREIS